MVTKGQIHSCEQDVGKAGNGQVRDIQRARELDGKFTSVEELKIRAGIGKATVELLEKAGCLKGMMQSNQMSLFTF